MRLIDADEMQEELKDMDFVLVKHNVEDWIDEQPTVDAEPVRHGKWIEKEKDGFLHCSNCGYVRIGIPIMFNFEYCPKCGAKMG